MPRDSADETFMNKVLLPLAALLAACGGPPLPSTPASPPPPIVVATALALPSPPASPPPDPTPPSIFVLNLAAARPPLRDELSCIPDWGSFHREARLRIPKDVDWLVRIFGGSHGAIRVVHYNEPDKTMDDVMALEGEAIDLPGLAQAWHPKHLKEDAVFFRPQPSTLGLATRAALAETNVEPILAAAAPWGSPPIFYALRDPAALKQGPFAAREIRFTARSLDDRMTRAEVEIDVDGSGEAEAAARALRERLAAVASEEKGDASEVARIFAAKSETRAEGNHVRLAVDLNASELGTVMSWLRARK
jgi:hypothetical protein